MVKQEIIVQNETGLHARPASQFVQLASKYKSEITVSKVGQKERINAKSIIAILSYGMIKGTKISIEAVGEDEREAVASLIELIQSNFAEA